MGVERKRKEIGFMPADPERWLRRRLLFEDDLDPVMLDRGAGIACDEPPECDCGGRDQPEPRSCQSPKSPNAQANGTRNQWNVFTRQSRCMPKWWVVNVPRIAMMV